MTKKRQNLTEEKDENEAFQGDVEEKEARSSRQREVDNHDLVSPLLYQHISSGLPHKIIKQITTQITVKFFKMQHNLKIKSFNQLL